MVDAVGRKLLLQSIVLPNLIGWLVIAFSETYVFLCVGRFITGFTIGKYLPHNRIYKNPVRRTNLFDK